jgi:hypothetical protein
MKTHKLILIVSCVLALGITSCQGLPTKVAPVSEDELKTLVAGTLTAVAYSVGQTQTAAVTPTETSTPTEPPPPPTATSTITPTTAILTVTLTGSTNCRRGASTYFPNIKTFAAGSVIEVLAINPAGDYFFVKAPEAEAGGCWIWGEFASLSGDVKTLPVFTPVPTPLPTFTKTPPPTPQFTVKYVGLTQCGANWAANFSITNTGTMSLQSIRIRNYLEGVADPFVHQSNSFTQWSAGVKYAVLAEVVKGTTMIVSTCQPGEFTSDPTWKTVKSEIYICPQDDLKGACTTTNLEFIPH